MDPIDSIALHPNLRLQISATPLFDQLTVRVLSWRQIREKSDVVRRSIIDNDGSFLLDFVP